jgi:multidrug resistance efflux pump
MRVLLSTAAAALLASCFARAVSPQQPGDLVVHRGAFASDVVLTGEMRAARGDDITVPRLPSWQTSIKWLATDGSEVKQGDRVVELDNSQFATNLDGKRQAVAQAEQELQQKEAEWSADTLEKQLDVERKRADADKARIDASVPRDLLSVREYQDRQLKKQRTETELAKATDVLRAQRAGVAADRENLRINLGKAQRELQIAEDAIAALILKAPRNGIVVLRDHPWEGRKLQEGDVIWVGFALAQIPEMSSLQVEASLPDVDDGKIARGMTANVVLDAYPSASFPGRVTDISAVALESSRNSLRRQFRVVVALDRLDFARMRPGLSSRVTIHRENRRDALLVPRVAIDFSVAKPRVLLSGGSRAEVKLGGCNAQECVVLNGLSEGDHVRPNA